MRLRCKVKKSALAFCLSLASQAWALDVYFVRHAETEANVTGHYSVESERTFTPKGLEQQVELIRKLEALQIDEILVSPKYRALHTLLPYLQAHNRTAEIWPELSECCWKKAEAPSLEPPLGDEIILDTEARPFFHLREGAPSREYDAATDADGRIQIQELARLFMERYSHSEKTILIVGHYLSGSGLFTTLLGEPDLPVYRFENIRLNQLRQQPDGSFILLRFNDDPFQGRP